MARSVPEWIGKTDDSKVPDDVRLRIFRTWNGVCHLSDAKIQTGQPWDLEHVIPLSMGGKHRESNLRPALKEPHKAKSKVEAKNRAKADAVAKRNLGIVRPKATIQSRGFNTKPKREAKATLPPRAMFARA